MLVPPGDYEVNYLPKAWPLLRFTWPGQKQQQRCQRSIKCPSTQTSKSQQIPGSSRIWVISKRCTYGQRINWHHFSFESLSGIALQMGGWIQRAVLWGVKVVYRTLVSIHLVLILGKCCACPWQSGPPLWVKYIWSTLYNLICSKLWLFWSL